MKIKFTFVLFFIIGTSYIFAKDNLAILPFTGGQGDEGETIAELFSFDPRFNELFNPIPRTSITRAINREQNFQMNSGMTDADTIVSIGHQLGAQYVVAGSITSVGNNRLLVISIMNIKNLQQIAGDFQTYTNIEDIRVKLPNMAANIIQATRNNTTTLPKLAIVPVELQGGADQKVADTLAQLLAVHLIHTGAYAVYPRTKSLEQVMNEHDTQLSGVTADANVVGIGYGDNPDMVLSVVARRLGNNNMFNAVIINLLTGAQVMGRSVDYRNIDDGMRAMESLAIYLAGSSEQVSQRQHDDRRTQAKQNFLSNSGISLGVRIGFSFQIIGDTPSVIDEVGYSYPPTPFLVSSTVETSTSWPFLIPLSFIAEIKLNKYFSLQTEFQYSLGGYEVESIQERAGSSPTDHEYQYRLSVLQIPILAKFTFMPNNYIISPFAGIGFNIPLSGPFDSNKEKKPTLTMPLSGMIGIEGGIKFGTLIFLTDVRFIFDFGEITGDIYDHNYRYYDTSEIRNRSLTSSRNSFDISLGIKYFIPFGK